MTKPSIPLPLDEPIADSPMGSLLGPISRVRDACGLGSNSFALDKYKAADHAAWRKKSLAYFMDLLRYKPAKVDMNPDVVEKVDCGTYTREKVYFNTTPQFRVPAYVLVPKGLKGRAPAIVALHSHGGFYRWGKEKIVKLPGEHTCVTDYRSRDAQGVPTAEVLAEQGYVVIVIDAFYWGERRLRLPDDPKTGPGETVADVEKVNASRGAMEDLVGRTIGTAGFTWPGVMLLDDIRTVDYLISRPDVDPDRIGCYGHSMGGWRAGHLTALDDRIKAGVSVCWLTSYRDVQAKHIIWTIGHTTLLQGLYQTLDMPDVISLSAPRALLCINGDKDGLFPVETGVKAAYKTLETVYAKLGAKDHFKGHLYDASHEFNKQMQQEAWQWFKKFL